MTTRIIRPCLLASIILVGIAAPHAHAQGGKVGVRCTAVDGALLTLDKRYEWKSVVADTDAPMDKRLVALFGAEFQSSNGAAKVKLVADVGERGPFPVLETAVKFQAPTDADLDLTVFSGIVVLTNTQKKGSAKVVVRVRDEKFTVTLADQKSRVGVEVYGRRLPGPFKAGKGKDGGLVTSAVFMTVSGEAMIAAKDQTAMLQAPPGTAMLVWDSATGTSEAFRFEKLPDSMQPFSKAELKAFETVCSFMKPLADKPGLASEILEKAVKSKTPAERKAAVVALGAINDLSGMHSALNSDQTDVREIAVLALRHWLGRDKGHAEQCYDWLTKHEKYSPTQAANIVYLLSGIEEEKRRMPSTYDLLIQALNHGKMPLRVLAHWHLVRLVPEGKTIAYDPAGSEAQRKQAIDAWRRLIPEGEMPRVIEKKKSVP
jgi:hypothetical protein